MAQINNILFKILANVNKSTDRYKYLKQFNFTIDQIIDYHSVNIYTSSPLFHNWINM